MKQKVKVVKESGAELQIVKTRSQFN